jgi:hypothetical protein
MRRFLLLFASGLGCALVGCAHSAGGSAQGREPTVVTALWHTYHDDEGLTVITSGAQASHPIAGGLSVEVKGVVDYIVIETKAHVHEDEGNPDTGHVDDDEVDVISGASKTLIGGGWLHEGRFEGRAGVKLKRRVGDVPVTFSASGQVSSEPDYVALSGKLSGSVELFERNTGISAFIGLGRDRMDPADAPPGETALWPARHGRWVVGGSLTQLLSPSMMASAGLGMSFQTGRLTSPYRRALVRTTLFPESLPSERRRFTGYAGLSWAVASGTALHVRQGLYVDDWGVEALAPEASLAMEVSTWGVVSARYRLYRQWAADFYSPRYEELLEVRSSDKRLGDLLEHRPGVHLTWTLSGRRGDTDSVSMLFGYEFSRLRPLRIRNHHVLAHIAAIGVQGGF